MRDIIKSGAALFLITALFTLALSVTNLLTRDIIAQAQAENRALARTYVLPGVDAFSADMTVGSDGLVGYAVGFSANQPIGIVAEMSVVAYFPGLTFLVGVDLDGNITGLNILAHRETPGLGDRIENAAWRGSFIGGSSPIDAYVQSITGATITVDAVFAGVDVAIAYLQTNVLPNIDNYAPDVEQGGSVHD
ncbi:MAG: FMN-binding protein [Defluviitaleaceae bacterium]|nr:FMN-binding protein [Defluviitaleaceae bacterium]